MSAAKEAISALDSPIEESISIREQVYFFVRKLVTDGHFSQKGRIVESQLAKELKISRTPVREALHTLEREGLLESIPRVGYQIRTLTLKDVEEL